MFYAVVIWWQTDAPHHCFHFLFRYLEPNSTETWLNDEKVIFWERSLMLISFPCSCPQDGTSSFVYADSSPLRGFAAWGQEEELNSRLSPTTNSSCVELRSTGAWGHVECEAAMFFMCEFPKSRRRGGGTGRGERAIPALATSWVNDMFRLPYTYIHTYIH